MNKQFTIVFIQGGEIKNKSAVKDLFDNLQDGKYIVEISAHNKRSNPQNRYYHGLVVPMVKKGIAEMGTVLTHEETHEFLKARFNYVELVNTDTGEVAQVPRSTTALTKLEFSEYVQKIQQFAAEFLGVVIPDPGVQLKAEIE